LSGSRVRGSIVRAHATGYDRRVLGERGERGVFRNFAKLASRVAVILLLGSATARAQTDGIWDVYLNGNQMRDVAAVGDTLFIATTGGAVRYLGGGFRQWNREPFGILSDSVSVVADDGAGSLWFGTERAGISVFDPIGERWSPFTSLLQPIPGDRIHTVRFQESPQGEPALLVGLNRATPCSSTATCGSFASRAWTSAISPASTCST
ncbi:MAG: hypothetical protein KC729_14595, partial [Candidatus Eisenbacteria bacterium]|nr:hypothetical protein [Candidatus Eisenbacteria bacterium]